MTGSELAALIRSELLEPIAGFFTDAEILAWINQGERDFINRIHGIQAKALIPAPAGRNDLPLPANWLSTRAVFYNDVTPTGEDNWIRLEPTNLEKLAQERPNFLNSQVTERSTPHSYWIWNKVLYLDPAPVANGNPVAMFYQAKAIPLTTLASSINVDDSLADGPKAYVLWKAWSKEKEMALADEQRDLYLHYVGEGRRWVKKQSGDQSYRLDLRTGRPFTNGGDPLSR